MSFPFCVGELAAVKTGTIRSSLSKTVTLEFSKIDPAEVKIKSTRHYCRLTMKDGLESFYFHVRDDGYIRPPSVASTANIAIL